MTSHWTSAKIGGSTRRCADVSCRGDRQVNRTGILSRRWGKVLQIKDIASISKIFFVSLTVTLSERLWRGSTQTRDYHHSAIDFPGSRSPPAAAPTHGVMSLVTDTSLTSNMCSTLHYLVASIMRVAVPRCLTFPSPLGLGIYFKAVLIGEKNTLRDTEIELCAFGSVRDVFIIALITV